MRPCVGLVLALLFADAAGCSSPSQPVASLANGRSIFQTGHDSSGTPVIGDAVVSPQPASPADIHAIRHVVVIMQENRSFDHYFGTFPGVDGIAMQAGAPTPCLPNPATHACVPPFVDYQDRNGGAPHSAEAAARAIDGGKMDGFVTVAANAGTTCTDPTNPNCGEAGGQNASRVMAYHVESDIPNYWAYAKAFVLHDHMFEPVASYSLPSHLYLISGWSAQCANRHDPASCQSDVARKRPGPRIETPFVWTDLTWLLDRHRVSWGYYLDGGPGGPGKRGVPPIWNVLPRFADVHEDQQLDNVQPLTAFLAAAKAGTLPAVAWIAPNFRDSEHPPALVSVGQSYVTHIVNEIMRGPDWNSTAIFLTWDDWGRFYDHVKPPKADALGLRDPRAGHGHQPLCPARLGRSPNAELRCISQVHRRRFSRWSSARSPDRRTARSKTGCPRERSVSGRPDAGLRFFTTAPRPAHFTREPTDSADCTEVVRLRTRYRGAKPVPSASGRSLPHSAGSPTRKSLRVLSAHRKRVRESLAFSCIKVTQRLRLNAVCPPRQMRLRPGWLFAFMRGHARPVSKKHRSQANARRITPRSHLRLPIALDPQPIAHRSPATSVEERNAMPSDRCCCIVPPYILEALSVHRSDRVRESAKRSLLVSERLRARRPLEALIGRMAAAGNPPEAGEQRRVFTCRHTTHVPGMIVRSEGDPVAPDTAVDEAYDAAGVTYEFYRDVFQRDSINDHGLHLISSVHYSHDFDNAFWNGLQMVYGDGDGEVFGRFTTCLDVIGHELTHGVVQYGADFEYDGQSGALNESVADVFGSLVKQWHRKQTVTAADWLIGAGLLTKAVNAEALRSLKAPGTAYDDPALGGRDPQPAHMRDYVAMAGDEGGVHINSGIPNHAFYLVATALGGHAWQTAGSIWYETITASRLRKNATFAQFAAATIANAKRHGERAETAVHDAWHRVGITPSHAGAHAP